MSEQQKCLACGKMRNADCFDQCAFCLEEFCSECAEACPECGCIVCDSCIGQPREGWCEHCTAVKGESGVPEQTETLGQAWERLPANSSITDEDWDNLQDSIDAEEHAACPRCAALESEKEAWEEHFDDAHEHGTTRLMLEAKVAGLEANASTMHHLKCGPGGMIQQLRELRLTVAELKNKLSVTALTAARTDKPEEEEKRNAEES